MKCLTLLLLTAKFHCNSGVNLLGNWWFINKKSFVGKKLSGWKMADIPSKCWYCLQHNKNDCYRERYKGSTILRKGRVQTDVWQSNQYISSCVCLLSHDYYLGKTQYELFFLFWITPALNCASSHSVLTLIHLFFECMQNHCLLKIFIYMFQINYSPIIIYIIMTYIYDLSH